MFSPKKGLLDFWTFKQSSLSKKTPSSFLLLFYKKVLETSCQLFCLVSQICGQINAWIMSHLSNYCWWVVANSGRSSNFSWGIHCFPPNVRLVKILLRVRNFSKFQVSYQKILSLYPLLSSWKWESHTITLLLWRLQNKFHHGRKNTWSSQPITPSIWNFGQVHFGANFAGKLSGSSGPRISYVIHPFLMVAGSSSVFEMSHLSCCPKAQGHRIRLNRTNSQPKYTRWKG